MPVFHPEPTPILSSFRAVPKLPNDLGSGNATLKTIEYLHRSKMVVVGGLIVDSPGDTRESVEANLALP